MTPGRRALDKIYKRRDRYLIPEWQRGDVWNMERQQQLIDSILRGWKLPKFYFVKSDNEDYEVVDGQQRLNAIFDFFENELSLSASSMKMFGGPLYKDLKQKVADSFDDFEIEFDEIEDATEEDLKQFFQRLQQGLPLTGSEKLNSVHSKLRDFCRSLVQHEFFKKSVALADTRLAHFDIITKAAAVEIEGIDTGLRFDDLKPIFEAQSNFSPTSAVAKRIRAALDSLAHAFPTQTAALRNRTVVQSLITFTARLIETGKAGGLEKRVAAFVTHFLAELGRQVELGQAATDYDYLRFQRTVNANMRAGARIRQEILLRKAFMFDSKLANAFDPSVLVYSGVSGRARELGEAIAAEIARHNSAFAAVKGEDLFKATNETTQALLRIRNPIKDFDGYKVLIDDLYFLFCESVGQRLGNHPPQSFTDVKTLRTDLQHDVDHGDQGKIKAKRKKIGATFTKYSAAASPQVLDPDRFILVQANLLSALELDLKNLATT
jgi:hypothetical protein